MIHTTICFPDDKKHSHTNSNQVLVGQDNLNYQNYYFTTCDDIQISLMEEQAALLLWSIRPIKGLLVQLYQGQVQHDYSICR